MFYVLIIKIWNKWQQPMDANFNNILKNEKWELRLQG
jgi:hypothetical protein